MNTLYLYIVYSPFKNSTRKDSPTQDAKDQIEHEERPDDDEGKEVDPVEMAAQCVISLNFKGYLAYDSFLNR